MRLLAIALLSGAILLAGLLHYLFWTWWLSVPGGEDELFRVPTRDGWRLALGRRRPRGPPRAPPVLLCHGIAVNRQTLDFGVERWSLSAFLSRAGFDCFALDLRGHGGSTPGRGAPRRWNLDTYLHEDVPAALDAIRERTGEPRVLWVGHSQGAMLGMAASVLYPDRIAGLVSIAGPVRFGRGGPLRRPSALLPLAARFTRFGARMIAPFSGFWHPAAAELAVCVRNVDRPVYRRLLSNAIEPLQPGVLEQLGVFLREDSFRSMDGRVDYRAGLSGCVQPALFLSAERDGLAPPSSVEAAFRLWGGPKRYWNAGRGYGHTDLLLGRNAPEMVFPAIRDFLLEASGPAATPPEAGGRASPHSGDHLA
jgi:pimeloyl-ACP methyl ester carboxylesterase